ncbi:Down syndrome cell adhesion molecule-like protein 1 homolog [Kryptolebias marmoratus]|uniref:Down syndrome cell adhesion molecule-like protein 1 homolog n=1 Tax=Kryptolebias marmoratus TaxID=37003 RepID=UPI000D5303C4|nr:Down syndrome cell adhesion molecule-like protein 1 homolog [Kryptolebias marmoratus]
MKLRTQERRFKMIHLESRYIALCWTLHFSLLTGSVSAAITRSYNTFVGESVTLSCVYNVKDGRVPFCWGRESTSCDNVVIQSDGTSVTRRSSWRYLLYGNLYSGDASLTITNLVESDSGMYGCRVEIKGWFNDLKEESSLLVFPARPNPPNIWTKAVRESTATLTWSPPFDRGRAITKYTIEIKNDYAYWSNPFRSEDIGYYLTEVTLVDLRPAKTYNVRMFAVNIVGISDASSILTITTLEAAPEGPPLDMQLQAFSSHSIKITWKPPKADLRNGVLRGYSINYREYDPVGSQFKTWQQLNVAATREVESVILTNLKPSTKYGVTVQAKTNAGIGPPSTAPLCSTLDEVPPDPPVIEVKEVKNYAISLFWTPGFEGSSSITGFYLEYKAANASWDYTESVVDFSPNQTEVTIIEINPSTYNIRMFAKNSMSISRASNVLTVTIEEAVPQKVNGTETLPTTHPDAVTVKNSPGVPTAASIVPVVLVVLIVAMVTA